MGNLRSTEIVSPERLGEIESRESKARPGPWEGLCTDPWGNREYYIKADTPDPGVALVILRMCQKDPQAEADMEMIAEGRQDIPDLCKALRAAWEEIDELRERNALNQKWRQEAERGRP